MHHFDNLIVSTVLMVMLLIFTRGILNSIFPGAGDKFFKVLKKVLLIFLDAIIWLFKAVLSSLDIDLAQKKLPGRRR